MSIIKRQLLVNYEYDSQLNLITREDNIIVASSFAFLIVGVILLLVALPKVQMKSVVN